MSWAAVAATMAVVSAAGSIQQGKAQKQMYKLQASQVSHMINKLITNQGYQGVQPTKKLIIINIT
jgi:hypothetical protein